MGHFDYGYFSFSKEKDKKNFPQKKIKTIMKKRTIINRIIACGLDQKFYDGSRMNGYGGFNYDQRWKIFLKKIIKKYKLDKNSKVLDMGSKKGFFVKDLTDLVPGIKVYGIEDHKYPIKKCVPSIQKKLSYVSAYYNVKYKKNHFDFVHAHNSIYRYNLRDLIKVIKKINHISKKSHITFPVYYSEKERKKFNDWSLLGGVILKEKEWKQLFKFIKYKGDFYFSGAKSYGL